LVGVPIEALVDGMAGLDLVVDDDDDDVALLLAWAGLGGGI
jgi:hypothetical protein